MSYCKSSCLELYPRYYGFTIMTHNHPAFNTSVDHENSEKILDDAVEARAVDILKLNLHDSDYLMSFVSVGIEEKPERQLKPKDKCDKKGWMIQEQIGSEREVTDQSGTFDTDLKGNSFGSSDLKRWCVHQDRRRQRGTANQLLKYRLRKELNDEKVKRKKRRNNTVCRQEEVYTDKDRAAAVNMGSRDIKQSLSMKRRQDRSLALQIPEEAEPSAMLALAAREMRSGGVEVALNFIDKALELSPGDKNALIARSKCYLLLGEPKKALADAEVLLQENSKEPNNAKAMYCKAEALYHLGDFELSLVYYYRGMKIRSEFNGFRLGVQKAQEAIQNIIGDKSDQIPISLLTADALSSNGSLITNATADKVVKDWMKSDNQTILNVHTQQLIGHPRSPTPVKQKCHPHLLGKLEVDKKYLQQLIKHPDVKTPPKTAQNIITYAKEGITFLKGRQEFWRQQRATSSV